MLLLFNTTRAHGELIVSSRDQSKSRFNVLPNLGYDARTVATHGGRADDEEDSDR